MSLQETILIKCEKIEEKLCLFCDVPGNLVKRPKPRSILTIQRAADRRKDEISEKIKNNYDFTEGHCSWHNGCFANYTANVRIMRRELDLLQEDNGSTISSATEVTISAGAEHVHRLLRETLIPKKDQLCLICGRRRHKQNTTLYLCSEISAATNIFNTAQRKQDRVHSKISTCEHPEDLFAMEVRYHRHCYLKYLRTPSNPTNPAGGRLNNIPHDLLKEAFEKLIDEIKPQFQSHSFELSQLAQRLAEFTKLGVIVENRAIKSLLIDKYGEKVLFSYPKDRSKSSLVYMSNINVSDEFMEHALTIDTSNYVGYVKKEADD